MSFTLPVKDWPHYCCERGHDEVTGNVYQCTRPKGHGPGRHHATDHDRLLFVWGADTLRHRRIRSIALYLQRRHLPWVTASSQAGLASFRVTGGGFLG